MGSAVRASGALVAGLIVAFVVAHEASAKGRPIKPLTFEVSPEGTAMIAKVGVRVIATRWNGKLASDRTGPWRLKDRSVVITRLNEGTKGLPIRFHLTTSSELVVEDPVLAKVPVDSPAAAAAFNAFAETGRLSRKEINVVIVSANPKGLAHGWATTDVPLDEGPRYPTIVVMPSMIRGKYEGLGHEVGHIFGFRDTTHPGLQAPKETAPPYRRCGLDISYPTFPRDSAPAAAVKNMMSWNARSRHSYFTKGYAENHRKMLNCWLKSSGFDVSVDR